MLWPGAGGNDFEPAIYQDDKEFIHQFENIILQQIRKRAPTSEWEPFRYYIVSPGITILNYPF
jgi:hypothetical protein